MHFKCRSISLAFLVIFGQFINLIISQQNMNDDNLTSNEPRSRLRDVQFSDNDTILAFNFESINEQQLPFYLKCDENFKFSMEKFTEDSVHINYLNLANATESVNATISLQRVEDNRTIKNSSEDDNNELAHYELLMDPNKRISNLCWNLNFEKDPVYWFGAPANLEQHWPINPNLTIKDQPYITSGFFKHSTGSLVEYLWFSSSGYLIFVERNVPLFISLENGVLCLKAKNNEHPYNRPIKKSNAPQQERASFKANIVIAKDIKKVYQYYLDNFVQKPERSPNPLIYKTNIWSTWVKFKENIDQDSLIEFAKNITANGFTKYGSIFEIDDKWEETYGSAKFDAKRFPNAKQMINEIKKIGFNACSVWITPFFNPDAQLNAEDLDLMVKEMNSFRPIRLTWWQGENATILDPTNPRSRRWFTKRIHKLLNEYGLDTFKADAGEISWIKTPFRLFQQDADLSPNKFSEYISLMISGFENSSFIELRTGFNSQKHGNLVRILDKDSNWSYDNGFKSLIPSVLTYSILGYPFILPDMIGGNAYNGKPDRELYLRWLQLNSLLPVMQYSIAPFDYDEDAVKIGLKFQELHNKFVPLFVELAENAKKTGEPIIRPIWWIAPEDNQTWAIGDQFLIGDNVLVAPILEQNQTSRRIYLPAGNWLDELKNVNITGPKYLDNYAIKMDEIAYFQRIVN